MDKDNKLCEKRNEPLHSFGLEYCCKENWEAYDFITSDGKLYQIDCTTEVFPDIDFKKIVYINKWLPESLFEYKRNNMWYKIPHNYDSYDSVNGKYKGKYSTDYIKNIKKKFNVIETIYTGLD